MNPNRCFRLMLLCGTLGFMLPAAAQSEPDAPPQIRAIADTYYVLESRQKYIELRGLAVNPNSTIYDIGDLLWQITDQPDHGSLYWLGRSTYLYVSVADFAGPDSFQFRAEQNPANTATVTLVVSDDFVEPAGLVEPSFEEEWDDYARPPGHE